MLLYRFLMASRLYLLCLLIVLVLWIRHTPSSAREPATGSAALRLSMLSVSPNGAWVAFAETDREVGSPRLSLVSVDGQVRAHPAASLRPTSAATWSAGSDMMAVCARSNTSDEASLLVVQVPSLRTRSIALGEDSLAYLGAAWRPHHDQVAVSGSGPDAGELLLVDLRKGTATSVFHGGIRPPRMSWSPDGSRLYFLERPSQRDQQWVLRVARFAGAQVLTAPLHVAAPTPTSVLRGFILAPDGKTILLSFLDGSDSAFTWYSARLGTGTDLAMQRLALPADAHSLAFSPDGSALAFLAGDAQGGGAFYVFTVPVPPRGEPTRVAGEAFSLPWIGAWTSNGQIVFTRDQGDSVWCMGVDGTKVRQLLPAVGGGGEQVRQE